MLYRTQHQLPEKELNGLWIEYFLNHNLADRQKLMLHYLWLVQYALSGMSLPGHSILDENDFLHIGIIGLYDAFERFEPERGLKFDTFALPRIRGTILDEMRRLDWLSRTARKKVHDYLDVADKLRSSEGREVSSEEIRKKLNVSQEEYETYLAAAAAALSSLSMQNKHNVKSDEEEYDSIQEIADPEWNNILQSLADEEQTQYITEYLNKLPERKKLVMMMYYYEELTFKEIGQVLNVTESRICQIHGQVVHHLRIKLKAFANA
ncbi:MAG: FliA/WhiG family RNA polymerase sigma factor [Ignavibacteria bacterium]|nr:FliA/WhiG family RNA polymerase sigma factor [Ignavibacteria bacterium]